MAKYQGRTVTLDKPSRISKGEPGHGRKKFKVYVKDGDKVKKVTFGDTTGLSVKFGNKAARASYIARHNCDTANDKTSAGYWSCRLPRYAKQLGLSGGGSFFW